MARILEAAEWETRARKEEEAARAGRDPRIPPGGSIGPGGIILDANGNPVLGADGKPMYVAMSGAIDLGAAHAELDAAKARLAELKRRQAAGELTPEEEEELRRLEMRLVDLEKVIESGMDAAAREAEEIRARILELKRRQAAGELTPEELAELERLEGRLAVLENSISAGRAAAFGACGVDANGIPIDKNGRPSKPTQRAFRALSLSLSSPWLTNCLLTACPTLAF